MRTFGTEGREATEEECIYVAPTDTVHPFLVFRGQDIKDLHVHEQTAEEIQVETPPAATAPPAPVEPKPAVQAKPPVQPKTAVAKPQQPPAQTKTQESGRGRESGRGGNRRTRNHNNNNNKAAPGTGASLLNRTARGVVGDSAQTPQEDFDFQSSLEKFKQQDDDEQYDNDGAAYEKDDFFDSISCDALDKQSGFDNRLKGANERRLNTETFGAVALNTQSRRRAGGRGGRGRGRGEGRGGRGRGRGGRGGRGRGRSVTSD